MIKISEEHLDIALEGFKIFAQNQQKVFEIFGRCKVIPNLMLTWCLTIEWCSIYSLDGSWTNHRWSCEGPRIYFRHKVSI